MPTRSRQEWDQLRETILSVARRRKLENVVHFFEQASFDQLLPNKSGAQSIDEERLRRSERSPFLYRMD